MKKVTLNDIAARLNLSKSLVSRALLNKYGVSEDTRQLIIQTAREMNYSSPKWNPNMTEPSHETKYVCLLALREDFSDSNYYANIIENIEKTLKAHHIKLQLSFVNLDSEIITSFEQNSGIIILGRIPDKQLEVVAQQNIPCILVDSCDYRGEQFDTLMASNHKAVYDATCYAIQCGYKNLAFIGSENYSNSFRERLDGFQSCVKDHANSISKVYTATGDYNDIQIPVDYEELEMVLSAAQLPLACICANDIVATLVYELAAKMNLSIPKDIAVIGFDNIPRSQWMSPQLTTIASPMAEMGRLSVKMLLDRMESPESPHRSIYVHTHFVQRQSVSDKSTDSL